MKLFTLISLLLLIATSRFALAQSQPAEKSEAGFHSYVKQLQEEAQSKGFSAAWLNTQLEHIAYRPTVVKADKNQPERKITLDNYLATRVPDWKVSQAVSLYQQHQSLLEEIGQRYGVQPRFIVALWGNESNFGKLQGKFDVLSALASLAYEGRREALFKKQFFAALTLLKQGHIEVSKLKGSWAGAMGQSQFMPTSFLSYAVDYDQDGRKDIWNTPADVFASIANFLASEGWNDQYTWGRQVKLKEHYQGEHAGLKKTGFVTLARWSERGVTRYNGNKLPVVDIKASLIMPDGPDGRVYLVYNNFHTLMKWNRSSYFGVSVGYLADRIKKGH
ncbi:lytic murein transglycosylase [Salinimonas marina]|uniref:Lytic murein transglycosylase n=1 Tax=Salinimonas marina TaxID=2785918 RepID=A0A7S9DZ75_9ALTE|nr:lytic murein transglycosylase [Salinimonas marina]QPG06654.1 lytic murein transglycosylase [Salinimonas marina]